MMMNEVWKDVDEYFIDKLIPSDATLEGVLKANKEAGIPEIDVSPTQGKLLYLLAKIKGAKNILEIGTLGGYSSIWLARALPETGKVYTLEIEPEYAKIAKKNIENAGCTSKVEVIVGKALETLHSLKEKGKSFDLIFIDADKPNNPHYIKWALELANNGALIISDNVVRNGEVIDENSEDDRVQGVRKFMDILEKEPRIESTAIQTVGTKGYDGFVISIVK
ncbi:O-methyltransferase [Arthrobacter citreus]|nr:O-methyltransferase [Arthrobacter citreus]